MPPLATAPPVSQNGGGAVATDAVVRRVPFRAATYEATRRNFDETAVLSASAQQLAGPLPIPSGGYISNIPLLVTVTSAGNAAAVTAAADAPWSLIDSIQLENPNGGYLVGPVSGYDLFTIAKYGGYYFDDDPVRSPEFSAMVTGAGATGGSFSFLLDFPVRAIERDAIGAFGNGNSAAVPRLVITLAPLASVYGVSPTNAPTVRVRGFTEEFAQPKETGPRGPNEQAPIGFGTLSRWTRQTYDVGTGEHTIMLAQRGNWYRTLIATFRTVAGVRDDAVLGPDFRFTYEDRPVFDGPRGLWRHKMQRRYGYAPANFDTGVYAWDYSHDLDGKPGGELRDLWLPTTTGSRNNWTFSPTTAGRLTILTNDIVVNGTALVTPA